MRHFYSEQFFPISLTGYFLKRLIVNLKLSEHYFLPGIDYSFQKLLLIWYKQMLI